MISRKIRSAYLHIDKATKTRGDKQLYLITHFTKQNFKPNYLLLTLNVTVQLLNYPNRKGHFSKFKWWRLRVFGSLSTVLYTSDLKWHGR